jgi:hypothetical protein
MATPCYLLEATDTNRRWLRRYTQEHSGGWTCAEGWHEAKTPIPDGPRVPSATHGPHVDGEESADDFAFDQRWPTHCEEGCGYAFAETDARQVFTRRIYRVVEVMPGAALAVGAETTIDEAPPGAQWYADWMGEWAQGPDGRTLMVKLPDGHTWTVDGEATNCTRKGDRSHRCWIRHGTPPLVTVDKVGETCQAGGGSIQTDGYHGFLQGGILT